MLKSKDSNSENLLGEPKWIGRESKQNVPVLQDMDSLGEQERAQSKGLMWNFNAMQEQVR